MLPRGWLRPLLGAVLLVVLLALGGRSTRHFRAEAQTGSGISYVYDDLGRLVAVIDPANGTAVYSYDAVGNILSITRQSATIVAVLQVTPNAAAIGAAVTIYGTGFSTTPSQNTVTFNGTTATVTAATATSLTTTVPTGATTGTVMVTAPGGAAASRRLLPSRPRRPQPLRASRPRSAPLAPRSA